ncbi:MAG: prolyl oligopeptidase family serine peptidase, partial [Pseudomonadales bacterium]
QKFQSLNLNHQVFYHKVGTAQAEDSLIYATPDRPKWGFAASVTEDGHYLIIRASEGTDARYRVVYKDLTLEDATPVTLIDKFEHDYQLAGSSGNILYFRTTNGAPKGRLIAINLDQPAVEQWRELVPESEHVLQSAALLGGKFVANYLRDAHSEIKIYHTDGSLLRTVKLPGIGAVDGFGGKSDDPETFYAYSSFNAPGVIYRYDVVTGKSSKLYAAEVDFTPDDYVVKQTFCASNDGTKVPLFVAHHKRIALDGNNPTLLYGYGGFNISLLPSFSVTRLAWMEMGGVYAVANLRGGGEYGEQWHKAGTKLNKQNVFDDFIAAGECLIEQQYTKPEKLAIVGRSNGGLLVGAVTNQRPDLFAAALPAVGVMDMLRFNQFTAGRFWVDDYGSAENAEEFNALRAYSPYHNISQGTQYPAVLVTTADTDDRVVPGHSFKYAAALQTAHAGKTPVLIRIETRAGHGSGKPTAMIIEEYADQWAFLLRNLNMQLPADYLVSP